MCSVEKTPLSVSEILESWARRCPGAPAIAAPGKTALTYGRLFFQVELVHKTLRACGLGNGARVAVVLGGGSEAAVLLLGVLGSAVCAPLNPLYSKDEFQFYLSDLRADAVLTEKCASPAVLEAAQSIGLPVLILEPENGETAGLFRLEYESARSAAPGGLSRRNETALVLHTSGTTSRPKLVPLSQENICCSAWNIAASLGLRPSDRCLCIMPLFHVHGLIGALLSSLAAGASVFCAPGFQAGDFFDWWEEFRPTWFSAVPALHRSVMAGMPGGRDVVRRHPPRFVRSCSAPLPPALLEELENAFQAPCIEAYGMTEAAHQVASNPLPPGVRKPGSVGLPTGLEVSILDDRGENVSRGERGEIAIRGKSVMSGYENNREANNACFIRGWFRTGDQGYIDGDGYLFLTGRLKELINRGGEKIAPKEIDDVLLSHPAVAEAVAFSIPDKRLGEEVAAAVVLKPGARVTEGALRSFAAERLAYFKVPQHILFVEQIPKTATGKAPRTALAKTFGLDRDLLKPEVRSEKESASKPGSLETEIMRIFQKVTGRGGKHPDEDFFRSWGGDSLDAQRVLAEVESKYGARIPLSLFVARPSAAGLAGLMRQAPERRPSLLVPMKPGGGRPPLFLVHGHDGSAGLYLKLVQYLESDIPVVCFEAPEESFLTPRPGGIGDIARLYVRELTAFQREGPYFLGGYCFGAWIAFEMARQMEREGRKPAALVLMDGYAPGFPVVRKDIGPFELSFVLLFDRLRRLRPFLQNLLSTPRLRSGSIFSRTVREKFRELSPVLRASTAGSERAASLPGREQYWRWAYQPESYSGRAILLRPSREPLGFERAPFLGWEKYIRGEIRLAVVPGYHRALIFEPGVRILARRLTFLLDENS